MADVALEALRVCPAVERALAGERISEPDNPDAAPLVDPLVNAHGSLPVRESSWKANAGGAPKNGSLQATWYSTTLAATSRSTRRGRPEADSLPVNPDVELHRVEPNELAHFDERNPSLSDEPPDVTMGNAERVSDFAYIDQSI